MLDITDYARKILEGESIEDKLISPSKINFDQSVNYKLPLNPGRNSKIQFSSEKSKFPSYKNINDDLIKAKSIHFFANHELLAIEMMAAALLIFDHSTEEGKKVKLGIISSLKDEQKHFKLYRSRLNDLGYDFGDFTINDFFWKQMKELDTPAKYFATMSLTFEAANLDFAHFYKHIFKEVGDLKSSEILDIVYQDEISHVAFGVNYFKKYFKDKSLWENYLSELPFPITPARSKGKLFVDMARVQAGMDADFIENVKKFDDGFVITKRSEWKNDI